MRYFICLFLRQSLTAVQTVAQASLELTTILPHLLECGMTGVDPPYQILFLFFDSFSFFFFKIGFSVALEPALELALVDQIGLEFTEIRLPLPPEGWNLRCASPPPGWFWFCFETASCCAVPELFKLIAILLPHLPKSGTPPCLVPCRHLCAAGTFAACGH